jgi:hypothetical protein
MLAALLALVIVLGTSSCTATFDGSSGVDGDLDPGQRGDGSPSGGGDRDGGIDPEDWVQPERPNVFAPPENASWRYGGGEGYPDRVEPDWPIAKVVSTRAELEAALEAAQPGEVVYVADDASIDLTGGTRPCVPEGVWLASGRGRDGLPGGELYTTTIVSSAMLEVCGDNARITGLRLIGPDPDQCPPTYPNNCSGTDRTGGRNCRDCEPRPMGVNVRDVHNVEIDNNELAGWSNAAIVYRDSLGGSVHHNHIHHTQRQGLGYGVVLYGTQGTEVEIAWNRFDYNRHAIAGSGDAGQSYHAHNNLVLEHAIGHVFDMHGSNENTDNQSPDAGTRIDIHDNTVLVANHYTMVIRGRPTEGAWLYDNCLAPASPADAALQRFHDGNFFVDVAPDGSAAPNRYGQRAADCQPVRWCTSSRARGPWDYRVRSSTSIGSLAFGDFDGDGITDVFSTTGSTWRVSRGGLEPWQDWNTSSATLDRLAFGDFTGDGKTDVLAVTGGHWHISPGGSGPWTSHNPGISDPVSEVAFGDFNGDGVTDAFRTTGSQWQVSWGASGPWTRLNASTIGLASLAFGDFNGDSKTDVFRATGSQWQVSFGGSDSWTTINTSSATLPSLHFADVTGDGKTDVLRQRGTRWEISRAGQSPWETWRISSDSLASVHFADFTGDGADDAFATGCL